MRNWTWMLLGLLTVALAACGERKEPPLPDDVTTEVPDVDTGTLVEDPGTVTTTGDDSAAAPDADSEAPAFDPSSEAPAFDSGGGAEDETESDDAGPGDQPPTE